VEARALVTAVTASAEATVSFNGTASNQKTVTKTLTFQVSVGPCARVALGSTQELPEAEVPVIVRTYWRFVDPRTGDTIAEVPSEQSGTLKARGGTAIERICDCGVMEGCDCGDNVEHVQPVLDGLRAVICDELCDTGNVQVGP